jgi:hemerythrin-like metal-binding protein
MYFDDSKHLLNYDEMDSYHKEFVDIYNGFDENEKNYKDVMQKILEQTKLHFAHEEEMMQKYSYPRINEHTSEHKKVIYEMQHFIERSNTMMGKKILQSYYHEALPSWFDTHLLSMDSDLANFLKKL